METTISNFQVVKAAHQNKSKTGKQTKKTQIVDMYKRK